MNPVVDISCVHETVKSIYCSIHDALKILAMAYGECIARKRHECVLASTVPHGYPESMYSSLRRADKAAWQNFSDN